MTDPPPFSLMVIGAHPDDCEFGAGGLSVLWRRAGQPVTFVSMTNGDAGHHREGGPPLARRRLAETRSVARTWGVDYVVLDHHDGELEPSLAVRRELLLLIRQTAPDLILTHRPNDYHPDHRATAQLVLDAVFLARIPNSLPLTRPLEHKPVIAYLHDDFQRPYPFQADLVIDVTVVIREKARMLAAHPSQVYEWLPFITGEDSVLPTDEEGRLAWISRTYLQADRRLAEQSRSLLAARYGEAHAARAEYAEAFEISEYAQPWNSDLEARLRTVLRP
jgi:N-acetylglucosamine malate deacetylase 1